MGRFFLLKIVKYSMCLVLEKRKYRQTNWAGRKNILKNLVNFTETTNYLHVGDVFSVLHINGICRMYN